MGRGPRRARRRRARGLHPGDPAPPDHRPRPPRRVTLIVAYAAGQAVGIGYGFRCTPDYWFGDLRPAITAQARDTDSLAGICELAVRTGWHGQGVGTSIHTALVAALRTQWVSLLAMPGDSPARRLYDHLGYQYAGPYRAGDGPVLDLLLLRTGAATVV
ncbi:GNAT family N-acetyltransferase [Kitasatospora purpeofusca]|uniref:GNAT family N-acetyltransferase n=1 Tax=Kitasatospora purpeofusca TaxID=67352 RepID=UPI0035DAF19F